MWTSRREDDGSLSPACASGWATRAFGRAQTGALPSLFSPCCSSASFINYLPRHCREAYLNDLGAPLCYAASAL